VPIGWNHLIWLVDVLGGGSYWRANFISAWHTYSYSVWMFRPYATYGPNQTFYYIPYLVRMSDPNIKQIKLVGGGETDKKGRTKKQKKKFELPSSITKEGGGSTSPGTMTQLASTRVEVVAKSPEPVGVNSAATQKGAPVQSAGANPVKVILAEAKKRTKVVLAAATKFLAPLIQGKTKKVKTARKVRVSMAGLSRKIDKAKTIRQKATGDSIEVIKKELHKAGLIKQESKAPETMLRQMYADFMMLKKRAL